VYDWLSASSLSPESTAEDRRLQEELHAMYGGVWQ
jgi:hypothetical protein